jgi:Ca2+-binding EF-hand superfamily protein|eukprot:COSAG01_NODE_38932_length_483_cov_1.161458_1_plen_82_part_00
MDQSDTKDAESVLRRKVRAASYTDGGQDWTKLFLAYDTDRSGELELDEFIDLMRHGAKISVRDVPDGALFWSVYRFCRRTR